MTNLSASIAELKTLVGQAEAELLSLQSGKKAAAPRVRASLQKIKTLSHSMRAGVMTFTKALPVNSRAKKAAATEELPPPVEPEELEELPPSPPKLVRQKRVRKKASKKKAV